MCKKKKIGNIFINVFNSRQAVADALDRRIKNKQKVNLYFLNDHGFNIAQRDEQYRDILNRADYLLNDGIGIKLGAKVWGISLKQNLNGTDLIPIILKRCEANNIAVFLLGSSETAVRVAAHQIGRMYGHLRIAGFHHGYFTSPHAMLQQINASGAGVLIVGMGMPLQEKFIDTYSDELQPSLRIAGGGYIDFASGMKPRAPKLIRRLNLEWLFRMILEPKRLWKRNVIGHLAFFIRIFSLKYRSNR